MQRAIQRFEELGHISRKQLHSACVYTVHPSNTPTRVAGAGVSEAPDTGARRFDAVKAPRGAPVAPKIPAATKPKKTAGTAKPKPTLVPADCVPSAPANTVGEVNPQLKATAYDVRVALSRSKVE